MSSSSEPAWDVLEERLQRVLGPAASASAQNTDRLRTWDTFFSKLTTTPSRCTWSYHDELAVHAQDPRADSNSARDSDQCDAFLNHVNCQARGCGDAWRKSVPSVAESELKCRVHAVQSDRTQCEDGSSILCDSRDGVSAAVLCSVSPPKKRIRREFEKSEHFEEPSKTLSTTIADGTRGALEKADLRSPDVRGMGLSEGGSGSESGATSSENSEESSVSSGASGLRRMRERIRRCKREMQMTQQTRRKTGDDPSHIVGEASDPGQPHLSGPATSGASISDEASDRPGPESSRGLGTKR